MNEIDTANRYIVGVRGDKVTSLLLRQEFTPEEAMNLAAYLVVMAESVALLNGLSLNFDEVKLAIERA